ncbi:MAG: restriction endonuclease subunit S [Burkholderiales bacterium]|nr:restriction endonuclease subunit S [Burkholderiales bacterium]
MAMTSDAVQVRDDAPRHGVKAQAQDVPPGYKRTELGTLPVDWTVKSLGAVLVRGRLGGNYTNSELETDFPLMKMGNVGRGSFDLTKVEFVTPGIRPQDEHRLRRGDVLFNTRNTLDLVGKVALWREELPIAFYNSNLMRFEFDPEQVVSTAYANYALNASASIERLRGLATGTTSVAAIYTRDLVKLPMIVPSLAEQRAIAEALSDVDGLLGALEALIAKKRAIKQAAMQQLLTGKTRLPGFSGEWETKRLGEIGYFLKGSGVKRDDAQSGHLACVRYGEIYTTHHDYIREFYSRISPEVADTATQLEYGDLLFAGSGETKEDIGKCVALVLGEEAYAGGDIVILRPSNVDSLFLGYALNMPGVARQKASYGQGDAVVHIGAAALAQVCLSLPPKDEQSAIATVLSDMDAEIAALEARRDKTRAIKQGMMQQLLTGRVRLVAAAPAISA